MNIKYINPPSMVAPRGYSHAISVSGDFETIYIGGQNAVDENGNLVGMNDLKKQTEQILLNIETILAQAGAKLENVIKLGIHILKGQNPLEGFQVFQQKWGNNQNFPTITVLFVDGLGNPDWLVEIDGLAVVPKG
jgi:enamine deaminase RidA (YjgF/YER057c/UK114 family)